MSKKHFFQFKSFSIYHKDAPLKVGTDAVLLSAIAENHLNQHPTLTENILDLGCGTGVMGQVLHHAFPKAHLNYLDIQEQCIQLAEKNALDNQNIHQASFFHGDFLDFKPVTPISFCICNPPFYFNALASEKESTKLSKNADHIHWDLWFQHLHQISTVGSAIAFIFPFEVAINIIQIAKMSNWVLSKQINIRPTPDKDFHRAVLIFQKEKATPEHSEMAIELSRHEYTDAYISLTKHLYLNF